MNVNSYVLGTKMDYCLGRERTIDMRPFLKWGFIAVF